MIHIEQAGPSHVSGIISVCTKATWATYRGLCNDDYLERVCREFYNVSRVFDEVKHTSLDWGGYFSAVENEMVIGAAGGGMTGEKESELYVLYLDPDRRNEGIGTMLLEAVTRQQKLLGAEEQWVSVQKGNQLAIPFYDAKGFTYEGERTGYANTEDEDYISLRYRRLI
ncbi:GNAT family N-acetyltransferase [Marinococcus halophilus]|uniref:N-acetyltransferase domain-containing protein n=1 Tax=Marinococcus halophilus TaxID=1371 RepID=A0A510Y4L1_MARHA|nr:GNAT family N-acetyltransferase [Marinococcus halophilus]OZT80220.1 GNAT family N-acetyltransferase [Marinococcus halophilus]GEK58275.1 hypothetical protein MHA01_11800 [Marinococcus halophilus]